MGVFAKIGGAAQGWDREIPSPSQLPSTGKPGIVFRILDDGDGNPATYIAKLDGSFVKLSDPDGAGGITIPVSVANGGTGATTAAAARTNLDAQVDLDVVLQAEAEAGTATTERIWTAQRVAQAIAALETAGAVAIDEGVVDDFADFSDTATTFVAFPTDMTLTTSNTGTTLYRFEFGFTAMKQGGGTLSLDLRLRNTTDSTTVKTRTLTIPNVSREIRFVAFAIVPTGKTLRMEYKIDAGTINFDGDRVLDYRGIE